MKLMIASDIHGSAYWCARLMEKYNEEKPDILLILGDILYHGPRNDLPCDYAPKEVAAMLNPLADKILCVRGNCDSEVDGMVLDFPIMAEYALLHIDGVTIFATHGHIYSEDKPPKMPAGTVLLCGHTHIAKIAGHEGFTYVNPGSVSIPKENTGHGYMIFEGGEFTRKPLG